MVSGKKVLEGTEFEKTLITHVVKNKFVHSLLILITPPLLVTEGLILVLLTY